MRYACVPACSTANELRCVSRTCAVTARPVTAGLSAPAARAASRYFSGWTPESRSAFALQSLCSFQRGALPPSGPAVLRTATPKDRDSAGCRDRARYAPPAPPSSQIASINRSPFFSLAALLKKGDPARFLDAIGSFGVAVRTLRCFRRAGLCPPFDCRPLGRPLAAGAASVERLPQPPAEGRGGCGWTPRPGCASRPGSPSAIFTALRLAGCSVTATTRTPPANSPTARTWPSLPCRCRSSPGTLPASTVVSSNNHRQPPPPPSTPLIRSYKKWTYSPTSPPSAPPSQSSPA